MQYQEIRANDRWFRFTGRRLQVLVNGSYITLAEYRSGRFRDIRLALEHYREQMSSQGLTIAEAIQVAGKANDNG